MGDQPERHVESACRACDDVSQQEDRWPSTHLPPIQIRPASRPSGGGRAADRAGRRGCAPLVLWHLPATERHFLKHDVTAPSVISRWVKERDLDRALALVAVHEGRIIADAVLVRSRHGAYESVAGVRVAVDPDYRQQGVGSAMLRELCDIAKDADLERVNAELVSDVQEDAIHATEQLGFIRAATIHELLRDQDGRPHDLVVMTLPLGKWYEWWQF